MRIALPEGDEMLRFVALVTVPLVLAGCGGSPTATRSFPLESLSSLAPRTAVPALKGASPVSSEPSCGPRPAPASSASLETSLTFPPVVSNGSPGQLTVRNASSKPVHVEVNVGWKASTVQGNDITSASPPGAEAVVLTTFAPGQSLVFAVALEAFPCGSDESTDTTRQIANGSHQVLAMLKVHEGPRLASVAVNVNYQAAP